MCWVRDVDEDGVEDLAFGCPIGLGGSVFVLGSRRAAKITTIEPSMQEGLDFGHRIDISSSFGTQVCAVPDQDGDGLDDLLVAGTSFGGARGAQAALSVVSTKTWKIVRVVVDRELAKAKSDK